MIKMNEEKCELISKHNAYRHLTKDGKYLVCHFSSHNYIHKLEDENLKLQNNWNELKKWLEENKHFYNITGEDLEEDTTIIEVLNKMQELENDKEWKE